MTCSKCKLWTTGVLFSALFCAENALAQTTIYRPAGTAPPAIGSAMNGELTASQIERDPGAPYNNIFQDLNANLIGSPKIGAGTGNFSFGGLGIGPAIGVPIYRAPRPENARIKLGDFYVELLQARATTYISDNINLTHSNRKAGIVGLLGLSVRADYQLNDGLRVSVGGEFIYLPFKNKVGVTGFGITDPIATLFANGGPLMEMGVRYTLNLDRWDVLFFDQFSATPRGLFQLNEGVDFDTYNGNGLNEVDRAGHLALGSLGTPEDSSNDFLLQNQERTDRFDTASIEYINSVGAIATSLVPTVSRVTFGYYHNNYWHSGSSQSVSSRLAGYNDTFFAEIQSQRENLRFKPFAYFTASKQDYQPGWDKTIGGGVTGPITDYITFLGNAGYVFSDNYSRDSLVWRLDLRHDISPTMYQWVDYSRTITQPGDETSEVLDYRLSKRLGPYLTSFLYANWSEFQSRSTTTTVVDVYRAGGGVNYDLGHRSSLRFTGDYAEVNFADPKQVDYDVLTLRMLYRYQFAETAFLDLLYQFQNYDTKSAVGSYYENLIGISVVKQF